MFETNLASAEMVLFWEGEGIDKAMMFSDFEATLDGYVGLAAYAGIEKRAAYLQLDEALKVRACVLFTIAFDNAGFAERSWNLPLRHMAEIAGRGPDMGGGPVNLSCRSQCSISWHAPKLWDPVMEPERNTFNQIAAEVAAAAPRFGLRPARRAPAAPAHAPSYAAPQSSDEDIPVLTDEPPVLTDTGPAWNQERDQMLERLAAQQLQINTLSTEKNETIARMGMLHQQQVSILEAQNSKLIGQHRAMKEQSDALRVEVDALRHQISSLQGLEQNLATERRLHEEQLASVLHAKVGEETQRFEQLLAQKEQEFKTREARIKGETQIALDQRLGEEAARFRAQMESLRAELAKREDALANLSRQMDAEKARHTQSQKGAADEFLHRLESLGMNFVAFHPGAGHISVPVAELSNYAGNPMAYAAAKCMVSEAQYRGWLAHYENPRCGASIGDNKCCDARLIRTDSPTKFAAGQSDRCARHQAADSAIDNVLRFR
ncbi:MAG: hypothetical protein K0S46_923 [Moraxellaceae bacterium]|jgi:hypothetical protein|nr:hypothetical protein [Moraxellaceae bacterium]